jgi:hypothetical protein
MYSRIPSDEQAAKAWFREYSVGLASVGISLGLTPMQQSELEHRLVAVCRSFDVVKATKGRVRSDTVADRLVDPVRKPMTRRSRIDPGGYLDKSVIW